MKLIWLIYKYNLGRFPFGRTDWSDQPVLKWNVSVLRTIWTSSQNWRVPFKNWSEIPVSSAKWKVPLDSTQTRQYCIIVEISKFKHEINMKGGILIYYTKIPWKTADILNVQKPFLIFKSYIINCIYFFCYFSYLKNS